MSQTDDIMKMSNQLISTISITIDQITEALVDLFESNLEHANYKFLYKHLQKGGKCEVVFCNDGIYEKYLKAELEKAGIVTVPYEMIVGNGKVTEGFLFAEEQREKVEQIRNRILIEKGLIGVVSKEDLMKTSAGELNQIQGLDGSTVKQISKMASSMNFSMSITEREDGKYDVHCLPMHREKLARAWFTIKFLEKQPYGSFNIQRAEFEMENEKKIEDSLAYPNAHYFISDEFKESPYLEINLDGFEYHTILDNESVVEKVERGEKGFQDKLLAHINDMRNPVLMEADDFRTNLKERNKILQKKYKRPILKKEDFKEKNEADLETMRIIRAFDEKQKKVEMKLAFFDNKEQRENDSPITNELVSYSEFFAHQWVNDQHDAEEVALLKIAKVKEEMENYKIDTIEVEPTLEDRLASLESQKDMSTKFVERDGR